jgi:protein-S-isoprenylcysteine O-methyltransferase Ste14
MSEALGPMSNVLAALATAVTQDLLSWPMHLALLLSVVGCFAGILAFRQNPLARETKSKAIRHRAVLYWISLLPSIVWYVLPFLPQARFPSLVDGLSGRNWLALGVGLAGAAVAIWNAVAAMRVVTENGKATGPAMADFLQPACLLNKGPYARVRHPMFLHDFLTHTGLAVAAGALTTCVLLPVYFALSAVFNLVEERWVLQPRFGAAFEVYQRSVPGYMNLSTALAIAILFIGAVVSVASADGF